MTDVVAEVKEVVDVEKEVEKSDAKDEVVKKDEKNGDVVEEKTENGSAADEKSEEKGKVKINGRVSIEDESTESSEVCGIKRKSEVGLESEETPVESSEKKQKLEESAEKEVEANGS